ncbi:MAG: BrnT family toxin [Nitrosomonas sp.]|nr:BrnT family toxin [Nitrosomonas sp.]
MVRQAHHERNQYIAVRPEPFEGLNQSFLNDPLYVDFYDPDHSFGEHRFILLGKSAQGRLLFVSYTERNNGIRLISAREATLSERKAYEQE